MANLSSARRAPQPSLPEQIRVAIASDPRLQLGPAPVGIQVQEGRVFLSGWVPRLCDKIRIEDTARRLAAPLPIESSLLVGPPGQHPDPEIVRHVEDSLMEDRWIDSTRIRVGSQDGVVRLTGAIDTTMHWRFAQALCWWIPGVRGVRNELRIDRPEPDSPELLAEAILLVMEKDPLVDRTEILVICQEGVATLSGTVGGAVARNAAENDAWVVEGVRDVVNQIEVAPVPGAPPILGID